MSSKTSRDLLNTNAIKLLLEDGLISDYLLSEILRCYPEWNKISDTYKRYKAEMYSGLRFYRSGGIQKELPLVDEFYRCKRCKHRFYRCGVDNNVLCCPCCRSDRIVKEKC